MSNKNDHVPLPGRVVRGTSRAGMGGGAILIGLALFLLFRGLGPGGTGSSGSTSESRSAPSDIARASVPGDESSQSIGSDPLTSDPALAGLTFDERKALSGNILTVLIDDYQYMIELPGTPDPTFRPATLARIIQLAALTKGDSNGIRVRVRIRQSARASAEKQLQADLEHSGIHRDAIMMSSEFVP